MKPSTVRPGQRNGPVGVAPFTSDTAQKMGGAGTNDLPRRDPREGARPRAGTSLDKGAELPACKR